MLRHLRSCIGSTPEPAGVGCLIVQQLTTRQCHNLLLQRCLVLDLRPGAPSDRDPALCGNNDVWYGSAACLTTAQLSAAPLTLREAMPVLVLHPGGDEHDSALQSVLDILRVDALSKSVCFVTGGAEAMALVYPFWFSRCPGVSSALLWPSEVEPGRLWLGKRQQSQCSSVMQQLGITRVVAVGTAAEEDGVADQVVHAAKPGDDIGCIYPRCVTDVLYVQLEDRSSARITRSMVDAVVAFIDADPAARTVIHCTQGVSRSAALCVAYLMRHHGIMMDQAMQRVALARPCIRPNPGFLAQLRSI